jgi:histidinol-phosphate/aromatic aminotransferase/cobyric acid decarboxylase-like protein
MSGSSQGIFHLLAELRQKGIGKINVFEGEYEGYKEYGKCLGLKTLEHRLSIPAKDVARGYWFISNPSARNGNIIPYKRIMELCEAGHKLILDLAYVGMTKPHIFSLDHKNIIGAVMSMSKPYGVFRHRIGGFTFTREPVESLYANKWFKDVPALLNLLHW